MKPSWSFFTEVRAATAGHCETVWRWRRSAGSDVAESAAFDVLPECVVDARKHGYEEQEPDITVGCAA